MKRYPPARRQARHPRVPAFLPAAPRARADGWTAERQARFLAELAITGSVSAAARKVGMARETAYRLRRKPGAESFAAAWDQVLGREPGRRKVTGEELYRRAIEGLLKPHIYRGRCTGMERKADNSALLGLASRLDPLPDPEGLWGGRSQSFAGRPASHPGPLPPAPWDPISAPGAYPFAAHLRG
ncbi:MAG: hypothetical protein ACEQR8_09795 [Cypionkella sp.]